MDDLGGVASRRDYLNQKFGRTGDLDTDINLRGVQDAALQDQFDALASNGHAVGRHGPRVTETALDNRAMFKVDPMSGTTTDFYTGLPHQASKNATQFTSREAMVDAEAFARNSPDFTTAMNDALAQGDNRFAVKGLSLQDALGPDYLSSVFGKSRLGTAASPTGASVIDFTGGTYRSVFKLGPSGSWDLYTMFPEPL